MNEIKIRFASEEDAAMIAAISCETFYESFASFNTKADIDKFLSEQFSIEILTSQVFEKENIFFLAYVNNEIAGYVFLKIGAYENIHFESGFEISRFYVKSSFIRNGIGKALMQAVISFAKDEKQKFIWLGVWKYNQRAVLFYTSFGFKKIGEQDFLLGEDLQRDWVMKLSL